MTIVLLLATVFLTLQTSNSYILLTANLEDVHAIAKQLVESPVAEQVKKIWRRASSHFNQFVEKSKQPQMRTADEMDSIMIMMRSPDDSPARETQPGQDGPIRDGSGQPSPAFENRRSSQGKEQSSKANEEVSNVYYSDGNRAPDRASDQMESNMKNASYYLSSIKKIMDGF